MERDVPDGDHPSTEPSSVLVRLERDKAGRATLKSPLAQQSALLRERLTGEQGRVVEGQKAVRNVEELGDAL